jgi:hypothetical protein
MGGQENRHSMVSRQTYWPADGNRSLTILFLSTQTDLPWDFSGCSPQGIPFLLKVRNLQQLKSLGSPVAASWSYRSWWEVSGDRQHPAGERLALQVSRQCAQNARVSGLGRSSQYSNHGVIRSLSSWRQPLPFSSQLDLQTHSWCWNPLTLSHFGRQSLGGTILKSHPFSQPAPFLLPFQFPPHWVLRFAAWWTESSDEHWVKQLKINSL